MQTSAAKIIFATACVFSPLSGCDSDTPPGGNAGRAGANSGGSTTGGNTTGGSATGGAAGTTNGGAGSGGVSSGGTGPNGGSSAAGTSGAGAAGNGGGGTAGMGGKAGQGGLAGKAGGAGAAGQPSAGRAGEAGSGTAGRGGAGQFQLTTQIAPDGKLPQKYYCTELNGSNVSPPLEWSGAPAGTSSFVIIFRDLANGLYHSAAWDIPNTASSLPENLEKSYQPQNGPAGMKQSKNTRNQPGYQGPCPTGAPVTDRPYKFTIYALSSGLTGLNENSTKDDVNTAVSAVTPLGSAELSLKVNTE